MTPPPPPPPPKPFAIPLNDPKIVLEGTAKAAEKPDAVVVEPQPDAYEREARAGLSTAEAVTEAAQQSGMAVRRGWTWGGLFWSALAGLAALMAGVWVDGVVEQLFARASALGWVGLGLAAAIGVAASAIVVREVRATVRQARIAAVHAGLAAAHRADDRDAARRLVGEVAALYGARPATANARAEVAAARQEIIDGRDLIDVAERLLMQPLDRQVRHLIATAAKRVSTITALSPRAVFDVLFVAGQAIYVIRRIAEIYGGRPGFWGFFKLARSVITHLTITGGMAFGDSMVQQFLGHGIASRLSARLGEGVLNGLLTTRIGLSAMAVCRPMPFTGAKAPGVADVAPFLFSGKAE